MDNFVLYHKINPTFPVFIAGVRKTARQFQERPTPVSLTGCFF